MATPVLVTPVEALHPRMAPRGPPLSSSTKATLKSLFGMGVAPEEVGAALVQAAGDLDKAFAFLRSKASVEDDSDVRVEDAATVNVPDEETISTEEEDRLLVQAIEMSLVPEPNKKPRRSPASSSPASSSSAPHATSSSRPPAAAAPAVNPLWAPPRYVPADNDSTRGPRTLNLVEQVQVRDAGYSWQPATAFLDTGNQHMTLVDTAFAQRHAIYRPDHATNLLGHGTSFGQAERWTTIHGVVPGASTRAPVVTIALKVRNEEIVLQAAVSQMGSHDLLIGKDVLGRLFEAGFRIGAGSM